MTQRPENFLPNTPEMEAFLQQIKADPKNKGLRLIFADWLEERGDPRGPLMRIQCEIVAPERVDRLENESLQQLSALARLVEDWMSPKPDWISGYWHRGLLRLSPTLGSDVAQGLDALAEHKWWPWCGSLFVGTESSPLGADGAQALASWPHLRNLTALNIRENAIGDPGARVFAASPYACNLDSLTLSCSELGPLGAEALANSSSLSKLTSLSLEGNKLGDDGARALASSPYFTNLASLSLCFNNIGNAGAQSLATSSRLNHLTELELRSNNVSDAGAQSLADSPLLLNLSELDLRENEIGSAGARALRDSPYLRSSCLLDLEGNPSELTPTPRRRNRWVRAILSLFK